MSRHRIGEHANVTSPEVARHPRATGLLLGGLLTGVLLVVGSYGAWAVIAGPEPVRTESQELTFRQPVTSIDVTLEVADGSVVLTRGRSGVVTIRRQDSWERDKPISEERVVGRTLQVRSRCPRSLLNRFRQCWADLVVEVPPGVPVRVYLTAGLISCERLTSDVDLATTGGDIDISNTRGRLRARSEGGTITGTELANAETDVRTETADVDLRFDVVPDHLQAATGHGDVSVAVPPAGTGADGYQIRAHTDRGGYDIDVPHDAAGRHTIVARTDDGNITVHSTN